MATLKRNRQETESVEQLQETPEVVQESPTPEVVVVSATGDQKLPRESDMGDGFVRFDW